MALFSRGSHLADLLFHPFDKSIYTLKEVIINRNVVNQERIIWVVSLPIEQCSPTANFTCTLNGQNVFFFLVQFIRYEVSRWNFVILAGYCCTVALKQTIKWNGQAHRLWNRACNLEDKTRVLNLVCSPQACFSFFSFNPSCLCFLLF